MTQAQLTTAIMMQSTLPEPTENAPVPEWVHLLPVGQIPTDDQRGPYVATDLEAIVALSFADNDLLVIDENHSTDLSAPKGGQAPARGWIKEMDIRDTGIWGRVAWNASGKALLADRAYRGLSPVILHDDKKQILAIRRASLTNTPNLRGMTALNATQNPNEDPQMNMMAKIAAMLGLAEDADEDQVMAALAEKLGEKADDGAAALQSSLDSIGEALGVKGADGGAILVAAQSAGKGSNDLVAALQSQVTALTDTVTTLQTTGKQSAAEAFVDGAIAEMRIGLNSSNRQLYIDLHSKDPKAAEDMIKAMPVMSPGTAGALSAQDAAVREEMQSATAEELTAKATTYLAAQHSAGLKDFTMTQAILAVSEGKS